MAPYLILLKGTPHYIISLRFIKTKRHPEVIKSLAFEDALPVIQGELRIEENTEEAQATLSIFNLLKNSYHFETFPEPVEPIKTMCFFKTL
jgi:hypothetical protein